MRVVFYPESIARCRQNRRDFSLRVLVRTRSSAMRKENIDHFFKYGTFPYGEWFEGSNKAAGKLPVATTLSLLDTVVVTRRRRRVTSFAFPSGGAPTGRVCRQYLHRR